jgi:uncharacterized OB-fold protein
MSVEPVQPRIDSDSEGFWQALQDQQLKLDRCQDCRRWQHPPLERCRRCGGELRFEAISGRGTVHSFIVVRYPAFPAQADDLPYVIALVDLDEDPTVRVAARLDAPPEDVSIGLRVASALVPLPGGPHTVPVFRPVAPEAAATS